MPRLRSRARTLPPSLPRSGATARLAMYLAAPVFTLLTGLGIPLYGRAQRIPRSQALLIGASLWFTPMLVVEALREGGDLHRALRELSQLMGRS